MNAQVTSDIAFFPAAGGDITTHDPVVQDLRELQPTESVRDVRAVALSDARGGDHSLDTSGFELVSAPTQVTDFNNHEEVMRVYYQECIALAKQITGASHAFTYDHLIREPGRQITGGGLDGVLVATGAEAGGGYINFAHMDYTDNTTWAKYLGVHNEVPPDVAGKVVNLNFWRGLSDVVDDFPLGVCDARTVEPQDLFETVIYGYGAPNYSWYNIGIDTFSVKYSDRHRWYCYPRMTPDEVLVIKTYDSDGLIGRCCPHGAFPNPQADPASPARRSVELRVVCFGAN